MCKIIPQSRIESRQGTGFWKNKVPGNEREHTAFGGREYTTSIPFAAYLSEYRFEVIFWFL